MAKPTEAPNLAATLSALNAAVKDEERFLTALKEAQDIVAKALLSNNGNDPRPIHRTRSKGRRRSGVSHGSRTAMLQTLLDNAPGPVTIVEIEAEMAKHGRSDDRRLIYSTLSYLARKGTAKASERGKWVSCTTEVSQQQAA